MFFIKYILIIILKWGKKFPMRNEKLSTNSEAAGEVFVNEQPAS